MVAGGVALYDASFFRDVNQLVTLSPVELALLPDLRHTLLFWAFSLQATGRR